jgi:sialate O-acetylesterase
VSQPVAVRYAWADNPTCNLYNSAKLPASPFRTDNWWPKELKQESHP